MFLKKITDIMLMNRHTATIISENGRFLTYKNGINQIFSSVSHFLFGSGIAADNYYFTLPHNLLLELLMLKLVIWVRMKFKHCLEELSLW